MQAVTFQFLKKDMSEIDYIKIFLGSVTDINNRFYNILVTTGFGTIYTQQYCIKKPLKLLQHGHVF